MCRRRWQRNNYISGLGNTKGQMVQVDLSASTDLHSLDEFRNLVLKQSNGAIVRLKDVANVTLGFDDYETEVGFDGQQAVYISVQVAPSANVLYVANRVRALLPQIQAQLPQGSEGQCSPTTPPSTSTTRSRKSSSNTALQSLFSPWWSSSSSARHARC